MTRTISRMTLLSILLTLLALPRAFAATPPNALPNFHQVAPGITRGAAPTLAGLQKLKTMGVRTIIDLRGPTKLTRTEQAQAQELGFTWINLPMCDQPPAQWKVDTLLATLAKAPKEPVFVHCQHGADRTGTMIGIYRVAVQGWSYADTYKEMRQYGFKPYYTKLANEVKKRAKQ